MGGGWKTWEIEIIWVGELWRCKGCLSIRGNGHGGCIFCGVASCGIDSGGIDVTWGGSGIIGEICKSGSFSSSPSPITSSTSWIGSNNL